MPKIVPYLKSRSTDSKGMKALPRPFFALLLILGFAGTAAAQEEIRQFHSVIDVGADASLTVTETITVNVEGRDISRGIYRDIPLRYEDANGRIREVKLDVRSVTRDGKTEPFKTEHKSGVLRIQIGSANLLLDHGIHKYEITYETNRQIRYFSDHDELYWNVTGNAWVFPILQASAEVRLPDGVQATDVAYFTGGYGTTGQSARSELVENGNKILFETTGSLNPREGLTVVVAFPKGVVAPVSEAELRADWLQDNLSWLVGAIALGFIFVFYTLAWVRVGRDPPEETIVPRWTPPEGISPGLASYIENRGFRRDLWKAFSASLLDLAVKGSVVIEKPQKSMIIRRTGSSIPDGIGVGQQAILSTIGGDGDTLDVSKSGGGKVKRAGERFRASIEREHRNQFYRSNRPYTVGGIALSVFSLFLMIAFSDSQTEVLDAVVVTVVPSVLVAILASALGRSFRGSGSLLGVVKSVILTAVCGYIFLNILLNIFSGIIMPMFAMEYDTRVFAVVSAIVFTNVVYFFIMGAPTPIGQKRASEIAGLKQYLTLAEKDRMNVQGAPEMSPQHFETLLPYAVALGLEEPWSKTFAAWTALAAGAAVYIGPSWIHGTDFRSGDISSNFTNFAGSLSDGLTASLPTPKSSSSGFSGGGSSGGGFSGGGGGGGGGGGW